MRDVGIGGMMGGFGIMAVLAIVLNIALLGGYVWVVVCVLRATGVIS